MGFFDKLKEGIEQGVNTVGAKSKEVIDTTKAKMDIDGLKRQKKAVLEEMGGMVYDMATSGSLDEASIKVKCAAVTDLDNQIKAKEAELEQMKSK